VARRKANGSAPAGKAVKLCTTAAMTSRWPPLTMNSHDTETPKKRLTAVSSPPLIGLKNAAKFSPICRPITFAGELDRGEDDSHREAEREAEQHLLQHRGGSGGGVERDRRHRRDRCLGTERDQEGQADAEPHRHAALGDDR
jgi:hypothetical protein